MSKSSSIDLTVMVVDHSARAHAVADAYLRDPIVGQVILTAGNDFVKAANKTGKDVLVLNNAKHDDPASVLLAAQKYRPDLVDVCQDDALANGTVDLLRDHAFYVLGPTQAASRLEWDKQWSREFMKRHNIPHPHFEVFQSTVESDLGKVPYRHIQDFYLKHPDALLFIKAAGLCGGKGAIPARNKEEAFDAIRAMKSFGTAGKNYLVEEGMVGEEASIYSFVDGRNFKTVAAAQDHKCRDNYDLGPNTGGMGAVAPAGVITPELSKIIDDTIIRPAVEGMAEEGHPYVGVLYTGVMITKDGPKVVEFNSRWGAPEAEVVVPGILTPMSDIAYACIEGDLNGIDIEQDGKARVCVVAASRGYPDSKEVAKVKGKRIFGLDEVLDGASVKLHGVGLVDIKVFGAGIKVEDGKFYANGGRLCSVVGEHSSMRYARAAALSAMGLLSVEGNNLQYRIDIGHRDVERLKRD